MTPSSLQEMLASLLCKGQQDKRKAKSSPRRKKEDCRYRWCDRRRRLQGYQEMPPFRANVPLPILEEGDEPAYVRLDHNEALIVDARKDS